MPTLDLGRVIPLERGTWTSGTSYEFMDSVQYEGSTYVSIFSGTHTAADANRPTTTLGQSTYWRRNARGFEPKGIFNTSTEYERDNLVEWGGSIYRCTANTTAGIAPSNGNYWTSFALGIGEYLGEWNSSDAYAEGAVVIWDVNNGNNINGLFRANQPTPANTLPSNTTYWDVMAAGFVWLGEWATGTTYRWRSVVSYHGGLYIAGNITGAPSDENPTLLTNWTRISDGFKFVGSMESLGSGDNLYYGDVVTFANGLYQVITATTGNDDPRLSPSKFRTLTKWWDYQGTWSSNDSYYDNQIIIYQNSVYRVNQTTSAGDSPDSAAAKFDTIIAAPENFQDYNSTTKRLQIRRATASVHDSTAYAIGEPVVTLDGNNLPTGELRIHDGTNNGGVYVVPAGAIQAFGMSTQPRGWLVCNGGAVSRTTYAGLFAAIGTTWGSGDGSTTFHLPDLRGVFLRGYAAGSGNDPDRNSRSGGDNVGSYQDHAIPRLFGSFNNANGTARMEVTNKTGFSGTNVFYGSSSSSYRNSSTTSAGNYAYINFASSRVIPAGSDVRPRNKYVQYCIKY